jgi:hypothetical protein
MRYSDIDPGDEMRRLELAQKTNLYPMKGRVQEVYIVTTVETFHRFMRRACTRAMCAITSMGFWREFVG